MLDTDGSVVSDFNPGVGFNGDVQAVTVTPENDIYAGGEFGSYQNKTHKGIAKINTLGDLDQNFNANSFTGFDDIVHTTKVLSDDKILLGGNFSGFNNKTRQRLALLNKDGSLDESFAPPIEDDGLICALAEQPDGKILVGGADVVGSAKIIRLNRDGSLDTGFEVNLIIKQT